MPGINTDNRVTIRDARIAYAQGIFTARAAKPGDKEKYGAAFLMPPGHPALKAIADKCVAVAKAEWGEKADEVLKQLKAGDKLPVHNGDAKASSAGYGGNFYINAGNQIKPLVLDTNKAPLTLADGKPYSGCYVDAIVEIWAQDNQHGKRINASLLGVQFRRHGERLAGGGVASADDFEALPDAEGGSESGGGDGASGQASPASLFS